MKRPFTHLKEPEALYHSLIPFLEKGYNQEYSPVATMYYSNFEEGFIDYTKVLTNQFSTSGDLIRVYGIEKSCLTLKGRWFMHVMGLYVHK